MTSRKHADISLRSPHASVFDEIVASELGVRSRSIHLLAAKSRVSCLGARRRGGAWIYSPKDHKPLHCIVRYQGFCHDRLVSMREEGVTREGMDSKSRPRFPVL